MRDTIIGVSRPTVRRLPNSATFEHQSHVRLWAAGPGYADLQIRGNGPMTESGKGQWHDWYAAAHLHIDTARELRMALDIWIEDQTHPEKETL